MVTPGKIYRMPVTKGGRPTPGEDTEVLLICVGRDLSRRAGRVYHQYIYLEDVDDIPTMSHRDYPLAVAVPLGSSKRSTDIVGGIYRGDVRIAIDEDGCHCTTFIGVGSWAYEGMIEDEGYRATLKGRDFMTGELIREDSRRKKDKKADWLKTYLQPVHEAYRDSRSTMSARAAFLARVISIVQGEWD